MPFCTWQVTVLVTVCAHQFLTERQIWESEYSNPIDLHPVLDGSDDIRIINPLPHTVKTVLQQSNHLLWKLFMFTQVKWSVCPAWEHCQLCLLCGLSLAIHIRTFLFFPQHYKQVKTRWGTMPCACEHVGCLSRFKTAFRNLSQKPEQRHSPREKEWFFCAAFYQGFNSHSWKSPETFKSKAKKMAKHQWLLTKA